MGHTISMRSATLIAAYGDGSRSPSLPSHSCDRRWGVLSRELPRACVSTVSGTGRGVSMPFIIPGQWRGIDDDPALFRVDDFCPLEPARIQDAIGPLIPPLTIDVG